MGRGFDSRHRLLFLIMDISKNDYRIENLNIPTDNIESDNMGKSHLKKSLEKKSKRSLLITSVGIILFIIIIIIFGQSALVNFSILLGRGKDSQNTLDSDKISTDIIISAPELSSQLDATNSAKIDINGSIFTDLKVQIRLYRQDELIDVIDIKEENSFTFKDIELIEGSNKLKSVAVYKGKTSENSNILTINYLKNNPTLNIEYPKDGISLTGGNTAITIKGKTDSGNTVSVNGYKAIIKNDGNFTYDLTLISGENKIKIISTDKAGNTTEQEIKINYSP